MEKLSPTMLATLRLASQFGPLRSLHSAGYTIAMGTTVRWLNMHSVRALITRGLLEECGQMPLKQALDQEEYAPIYCVSEAGRKILEDAPALTGLLTAEMIHEALLIVTPEAWSGVHLWADVSQADRVKCEVMSAYLNGCLKDLAPPASLANEIEHLRNVVEMQQAHIEELLQTHDQS